jgi:hypothetical protein
MFDHWLAVILGTGEHIDLNALATEFTAIVTHVDVHAARFFAA